MPKFRNLILFVALGALAGGCYAAMPSRPSAQVLRKEAAVIWKNGVMKTLSIPSDCSSVVTKTIVVSGKDIYIAGYFKRTQDAPTEGCYWKNDEYSQLSVPGETGVSIEIASMAVSGKDVYVGGCYSKDNIFYPALWKNGVWVELTTSSGEIKSVFASGNDIYVAGRAQGVGYWKNGVWTELQGPLDTFATANSIAVSGNDVFVGGEYGIFVEDPRSKKTTPCYWKNGEPIALKMPFDADRGEVTSLVMSSSDVYALGWSAGKGNQPFIGYWKNGEWVSFIGPELIGVYGMTVSGNDVYACGNTMEKAGYFKNGNWTELERCDAACSITVSGSDVYIAGAGLDR
jgi:hypothetical protein